MQHLDAGRFERRARCRTILEQEMREAAVADDPGSAALDADAGIAERRSLVGERAGMLFSQAGQIDVVITGKQADAAILKQLEDQGVSVIRV